MKNITKVLFVILIAFSSISQTFSQNRNLSEKAKDLESFTNVKYRLFHTDNETRLLKLNTQNGLIWQVQYDIEGKNSQQNPINTLSLISQENEINDRFTLYPTYNIYTFILLDQIDGRMWQVHWSVLASERGIIPIE